MEKRKAIDKWRRDRPTLYGYCWQPSALIHVITTTIVLFLYCKHCMKSVTINWWYIYILALYTYIYIYSLSLFNTCAKIFHCFFLLFTSFAFFFFMLHLLLFLFLCTFSSLIFSYLFLFMISQSVVVSRFTIICCGWVGGGGGDYALPYHCALSASPSPLFSLWPAAWPIPALTAPVLIDYDWCCSAARAAGLILHPTLYLALVWPAPTAFPFVVYAVRILYLVTPWLPVTPSPTTHYWSHSPSWWCYYTLGDGGGGCSSIMVSVMMVL